jgi:hypothetical protein
MKNSAIRRGALLGALVGAVALLKLYFVSTTCLQYFISQPTTPWPWYCVQANYDALSYFSFPLNVLTNDLAQAVYLFPLTLAFYALLGALIGGLFSRKS